MPKRSSPRKLKKEAGVVFSVLAVVTAIRIQDLDHTHVTESLTENRTPRQMLLRSISMTSTILAMKPRIQISRKFVVAVMATKMLQTLCKPIMILFCLQMSERG